MKAITLTQPWATLVTIGAKKIETRSWSTKYRGPLAIHAAKNVTREATRLSITDPFLDALVPNGLERRSHDVPLGVVVATCTLKEVIPIVSGVEPSEEVTCRCVAVDDDGAVRIWSELKPTLGVHSRSGIAYPTTAEHEAEFGDYTPGRFAWILTDVKKLREPIPAKGALGLWEWSQ